MASRKTTPSLDGMAQQSIGGLSLPEIVLSEIAEEDDDEDELLMNAAKEQEDHEYLSNYDHRALSEQTKRSTSQHMGVPEFLVSESGVFDRGMSSE